MSDRELVRFFVKVQANDEEFLTQIQNRLQGEFPLEPITERSGHEILCQLRPKLPVRKLEDFQRHAERLEGLYHEESFSLRFGYVFEGEVILACNATDPHSIPIGGGIFARRADKKEFNAEFLDWALNPESPG